jgi:hypothetical protein
MNTNKVIALLALGVVLAAPPTANAATPGAPISEAAVTGPDVGFAWTLGANERVSAIDISNAADITSFGTSSGSFFYHVPFGAPSNDLSTSSTSFTLRLPDGKYWWRVAAFNTSTLSTSYSTPTSFTVSGAGAPTLTTPPDGSKVSALTTPALAWDSHGWQVITAMVANKAEAVTAWNPFYDEVVRTWGEFTANNLPGTEIPPIAAGSWGAVLRSGTYYWGVDTRFVGTAFPNASTSSNSAKVLGSTRATGTFAVPLVHELSAPTVRATRSGRTRRVASTFRVKTNAYQHTVVVQLVRRHRVVTSRSAVFAPTDGQVARVVSRTLTLTLAESVAAGGGYTIKVTSKAAGQAVVRTSRAFKVPALPPKPKPSGGGGGDIGLPIQPHGGGDLDCSDIGHPVQVLPGDPDNLDSDGDGIGCESS